MDAIGCAFSQTDPFIKYKSPSICFFVNFHDQNPRPSFFPSSLPCDRSPNPIYQYSLVFHYACCNPRHHLYLRWSSSSLISHHRRSLVAIKVCIFSLLFLYIVSLLRFITIWYDSYRYRTKPVINQFSLANHHRK